MVILHTTVHLWKCKSILSTANIKVRLKCKLRPESFELSLKGADGTAPRWCPIPPLRLLWFLHFACKLQTEWTVYSLINFRAHYFLQYKYNLDKRMGSYNKDYTFSYFSGKWYCAVFLVSCEDLVSLKVIFSRAQKNSLIRKGFK